MQLLVSALFMIVSWDLKNSNGDVTIRAVFGGSTDIYYFQCCQPTLIHHDILGLPGLGSHHDILGLPGLGSLHHGILGLPGLGTMTY